MTRLDDHPEPRITGYHAHVYFDAGTVEAARALCLAATERFGVAMGRVHERLVGPHPAWSCQLAFRAERFGEMVPWLNLHRGALTVFVHPLSGDELADHRDRAIWLGASHTLDLSVFATPAPTDPD